MVRSGKSLRMRFPSGDTFACVPVAESDDCFEVRKTPPAIAPGETPESICQARVCTMRCPSGTLYGTQDYLHLAQAPVDSGRFGIITNRRERPRMPVVAGDKMEQKVGLVAVTELAVSFEHLGGEHLVAEVFG